MNLSRRIAAAPIVGATLLLAVPALAQAANPVSTSADLAALAVNMRHQAGAADLGVANAPMAARGAAPVGSPSMSMAKMAPPDTKPLTSSANLAALATNMRRQTGATASIVNAPAMEKGASTNAH